MTNEMQYVAEIEIDPFADVAAGAPVFGSLPATDVDIANRIARAAGFDRAWFEDGAWMVATSSALIQQGIHEDWTESEMAMVDQGIDPSAGAWRLTIPTP